MSKVSIRFFNDREVCAIWDEENSKWWFSATDNIQLVSLTHDFKFQSPDGQSKKKAYTFLQNNLVADEDIGTTKSLQQIHAYIFGGLYDFAGKIRAKTMTAKCS